ncbi:hypothetical protein Q7C36_012034 [Tachysurus vachellii]|uniref:Saposin B-type domain-containing protein n=1 Tax=Tachysurus vachellii TaxID=175792 RepID=A0AA88MSN4_TACVA|nr:hypothetical protein Q7C36_012034 [Tachysurus vachellii]
MRTLFHIAFFLLTSGILHGEIFPQNPQTQDETETGMFHKSFFVDPRHGISNHTEDLRFLKCAICKKIVNSIIKRVDRRIKETTFKVCLSFLKKYRHKCFKKLKKLRPKLINGIFPEGGRGTCWRMEILVADSCAVTHEPSLKNKTEKKLLIRIDSSPSKREDVNKKVLKCIACMRFMKKTMPSFSRNLRKNLIAACDNFADSHRQFCIKEAVKFYEAVMDFVYPNKNARLACTKLNMCKKRPPLILS